MALLDPVVLIQLVDQMVVVVAVEVAAAAVLVIGKRLVLVIDDRLFLVLDKRFFLVGVVMLRGYPPDRWSSAAEPSLRSLFFVKDL